MDVGIVMNRKTLAPPTFSTQTGPTGCKEAAIYSPEVSSHVDFCLNRERTQNSAREKLLSPRGVIFRASQTSGQSSRRQHRYCAHARRGERAPASSWQRHSSPHFRWRLHPFRRRRLGRFCLNYWSRGVARSDVSFRSLTRYSGNASPCGQWTGNNPTNIRRSNPQQQARLIITLVCFLQLR